MLDRRMGPSVLSSHCELNGHGYVSRLASGKARAVSDRTAALIADALDVPVGLLFDPVARRANPTDVAA
jgi:transcriptional regulator with XRE-family HTH domain